MINIVERIACKLATGAVRRTGKACTRRYKCRKVPGIWRNLSETVPPALQVATGLVSSPSGWITAGNESSRVDKEALDRLVSNRRDVVHVVQDLLEEQGRRSDEPHLCGDRDRHGHGGAETGKTTVQDAQG